MFPQLLPTRHRPQLLRHRGYLGPPWGWGAGAPECLCPTLSAGAGAACLCSERVSPTRMPLPGSAVPRCTAWRHALSRDRAGTRQKVLVLLAQVGRVRPPEPQEWGSPQGPLSSISLLAPRMPSWGRSHLYFHHQTPSQRDYFPRAQVQHKLKPLSSPLHIELALPSPRVPRYRLWGRLQ